MKFFGKELKFNDNKVYHSGDKPTPSEIGAAVSSHTHSNYANQNAFSNIAVSGQTTVAADTTTDTLTLKAGSNVTITTDATNDAITISSTNTTYTAGTGMSLSGTTFNHKNSVTAGTAQGDASKTLSFGGTFTIPTVTYDAQGHITSKGTTTMTMPSNPNTDTKVTNTLNTTTKAYLTGTTSASTNTGTQIFDTGVYLDTTAGKLVSNSLYVAKNTTIDGDLSVPYGTATVDFLTVQGTGSFQDDITVASGHAIYVGGNSVYHAGNKPSLSALGAAAASHTHSYLPLSGGTVNGTITARSIDTETLYSDLGVCSEDFTVGNKLLSNRLTTGNQQLITADSSTVWIANPASKVVLECSENPKVSVAGTQYTMYHSGNHTLKDHAGEGLSASNPLGSLYMNNSGKTHVGRLSCYYNNDTTTDYISMGLYNVADAGNANYFNIYPDYITTPKSIRVGGNIRINGKFLTISTSAPSSPATGDVWINI